MTTSLSVQLERLAVPQTAVLQKDNKRASLLFDPKEAAGLRRETVYQIGLDGLEELVSKNQVFDQFKNNLFHFTSKSFERSIETNKSNEKLDRVIKKFLLQLSPYFLLSCSHKALEWLIYRYSIHQYNREDLLMTILPYHESNIFVRVVQLMKFKDQNDSWFFLKSLQKPGVHLTKQNLLNRAAKDVNLIKFVANFVALLVKQHDKPNLLTVAFNFYCTIFAGALEYSKEVNEAQITQMLPTLVKGLNSDIPDYCAASYIILGRLVLKTPLNDSVLRTFIERISEAKVETLKTETVLILLVIYQSQTHYNVVPENACARLIHKEWLPKVIQELSAGKCHVMPFLQALVTSCVNGAVNSDNENYRDFIGRLLAAVKFEDSFVEKFLSILLDGTKSNKVYPDHIQKWLTEIIETLERQYPDPFDKEVYKILSTTEQGQVITRRQSLQKILKETMTAHCKFDVLDKLYHPNAALRQQALQYLSKNFDSLRDREKEMIKSSFVDRLNDDDVFVVKETLALVRNVSVLKSETTKEVLKKLAYKCQKDLSNWKRVSTDIIVLLCINSDPNDWETFLAVFPYLLPNSEDELKAAHEISRTSFIRKNPLLKTINGTLEDSEQFCNNVFDNIRNDNIQLVEDFLKVIKQTPLEERNVLNKYLITIIVSCILPENSPLETCTSIVDLFVNLFQSSKIKYGKGNAFFQRHIVAARAGQFHIEAFLLCLKNVIAKTEQLPSTEYGRIDFHQENHFNRYLILLANALMRTSPNYQKYIHFFLNSVCKTLRDKIELILNLITSDKCPNPDFALEGINWIVKILELAARQNSDFVSLLSEDSVLVSHLLALLQHKNERVKEKTFAAVKILVQLKGPKFYVNFLKDLLAHQEEIVADNDQLALIIFNYLSPADVQYKKILLSALVKASSDLDYPLYLKAKILEPLSLVSTIDILEVNAQDCLTLLNSDSSSLDEVESSIVARNLMNYQTNIAGDINLGSKVWDVIETCLKKDQLVVNINGRANFAIILLLKQFDKEFFSKLDDEVASKLLDLIVELATVTGNHEVLPAVRHIIKVIELDGKLILNHFTAMRDVQSPKLDPNKLKRRISVIPTIDILDTLQWKMGLTALEFIQEKKKIRNIDVLLPVLFELLKKCLDFDEQAAVEYPKQLILSSILYLGMKTDHDELPETMFNIELIVQCIRASQNPQTHYCALLVLAFSAELFPSQVLHHIMAIFTFMGSSVLRHEDAYSFQIISKIIDTIIPLLVKDSNPDAIAKVLRVFVDAILDIPEHRRMPIFRQLLTKVGVNDYLYVFLLLVFEAQVNHHSNRLKDKGDDMKRQEIASDVCREFTPQVVIETCIHLLKYLQKLPDEINKENESSQFDIQHKTPKQFRHYKYTAVIFMSKLLPSREFVTKVASLNNEEMLGLEQLYKNLIVGLLTYIHRTAKIVEKNATTPHSKYWKVILHLTYDILDSVNALLTPQMFLLVMKGLMSYNINTIRRRSLELLNTKLQNNSSFFNECEKKDIYSLVPSLISIVKNIEDEDDLDSDEELIIQTALLSLKLLVRLLVAEFPTKLVEILDFITTVLKSGKAQNNILASLVLCLGEFCYNLRARAISSLPNFMPALLKILKQQKHQESPTLLLLSCITALHKILETLPLFMSPYLEKLLYELSVLSSRWKAESDERVQPVLTKLASVCKQLGTLVPARVLIPALGKSYNRLITKEAFDAVEPMMDILGVNLINLTGAEINANLPELTTFFLTALQFRSDGRVSFEKTNEVENGIVKTLTKLILKLSESTFKPLYYKIFDWAARHEVKTERLITFYTLSSGIADSLKSLFTLFAGHFLNNAAQILDSCNVIKGNDLYFEDEKKNLLLLEQVMRTLQGVFTYDNNKFINKDRFAVLMQPLVDQLENTLGGPECLEERNEALVTPCIVKFAVATADDSLWKQLNYQILLKLKHNSPNIRLISLHCLKEMVKQLGVDYLPLLPETIPVLAELLEDEEENVEKACRKAVQEMEKILGEPIEKYFKM